MEEAARGGLAEQEPQQAPQRAPQEWARRAARDISRFAHLLDSDIYAQKAARARARAEAIRRGLDADLQDSGNKPARRRARIVELNPRKMNPWKHAERLLSETSLPLDEVVELSGLNIYDVVGLKLKMRSAA